MSGESSFHSCLQALKEALYSCMSHQGQELVQALALALVQTCPRHLLRSLASPLRTLLQDDAMSDAVKSSFSQMVCSQQYIGSAQLYLWGIPCWGAEVSWACSCTACVDRCRVFENSVKPQCASSCSVHQAALGLWHRGQPSRFFVHAKVALAGLQVTQPSRRIHIVYTHYAFGSGIISFYVRSNCVLLS